MSWGQQGDLGRDPWESLCFLPQPLPGETPAEVVGGGAGLPARTPSTRLPSAGPGRPLPGGRPGKGWSSVALSRGRRHQPRPPHWPDRSCSGKSPSVRLAGREGEHTALLSWGSRAGGTVAAAASGGCGWRGRPGTGLRTGGTVSRHLPQVGRESGHRTPAPEASRPGPQRQGSRQRGEGSPAPGGTPRPRNACRSRPPAPSSQGGQSCLLSDRRRWEGLTPFTEGRTGWGGTCSRSDGLRGERRL